MTERKLRDLLYDLQIDRDTESYEVSDALIDKGCNHRDFRISDGASKLCIIFYDLPFVVKWSYGEAGYDEALEELEIYKKACQAGIEYFFPKTELFCVINGVVFVKQQKITNSVSDTRGEDIEHKIEKIGHNASEKVVEKMEKEFHKTHGYHRRLSRLWAKAALVIYGKRKCKALCEFVVKNNINDLHENNIGFMGINPIILDFSGYHRGEDESWSLGSCEGESDF